ncbi:MAG: hypothetical protein PSX71_08655 [bacterium]|nr:hypothetical protein [bacterium]
MAAPLLPPMCTTGDYTPINGMVAVTPADGTDLPNGTSRAIWVNVAGNINMVDAIGNTVLLAISATQAGTIIWIRAKRILATSTTCTGIFAAY